MVPEQIEREVAIAAPVERVWEILTEAKHIGTWFADKGAEVDLQSGGAMTFRFGNPGPIRARIERVDPPTFFSFRWARPTLTEPIAGNSTLVEFTLIPEGTGTRLRVVESGFRDLDVSDEKKAAYVVENTKGWEDELAELAAYSEKLAA